MINQEEFIFTNKIDEINCFHLFYIFALQGYTNLNLKSKNGIIKYTLVILLLNKNYFCFAISQF